jgi:hypothetical protein
MEGSRHEKAALVITAYAIGIITAYIYSLEAPVTQISLSVPAVSTLSQPASLAQASLNKAPVIEETKTNKLVSYEAGVLRVNLAEGSKILSFNPTVSGIEATEDFLVQGVHYGELTVSTPETEEYVFFCEKKTVDATLCSPFVFDVLTDTIYPVRQNGTLVDILATAVPTWEGTVLKIGRESSTDQTKPWLLGY